MAERIFLYENMLMHYESPLTAFDLEEGRHYSRIYAHYLSHRCFLEENQLLDGAGSLRTMPIMIVHGR